MSREQERSGSEFTRGWETFGHFVSMFRLAAVRHVLISILVGGTLASCSFLTTFTPQQRKSLVPYMVGSAYLNIGNSIRGAAHQLGKEPQARGTQTEKIQAYRKVFSSRSAGFLFKQWFERFLGWTLPMGVFGWMLIRRYGRWTLEDRRVRGASMVDSRSRKAKSNLGKAVKSVAGIGAVAAAFAWISLSPEKRHGLAEFVWAAALQSLPPLKAFFAPSEYPRVAWFTAPREGFYRPEVVYDWYRGEVFGGPASALIVRWLISCSGVTALMAAASLVWPIGRKTAERFTARITGVPWLAKVLQRKPKPKVLPVDVAGIQIAPEEEVMHVLLLGTTGVGKSQVTKKMLRQIRERGQRVVLYDASGEYIEEFYRPGVDKILNPLDARSERWSPYAEARNAIEYVAMARSMFPAGGRDSFWNDAATAIFAAACELYRPRSGGSFRKFQQLACSSIDDLKSTFGGTPAARYLDGESGNMAAGVLASVNAKMQAWAWLPEPKRGERGFSIKNYIRSDSDSWLFFSGRADMRKAMRPILSLWYDIAARALLSLEPDSERRVWFVLDELASLDRLPALSELLSEGRKFGGAAILGFQNIGQIRDIYGREAANGIASLLSIWLIMRCPEPETAKWLEEALGKAEVEEASTGISVGAQGAREGASIQRNLRQCSLVLAAEIMALPNLQGYLRRTSRGIVHRVSFPYEESKKRQPIIVPRTDEVKMPRVAVAPKNAEVSAVAKAPRAQRKRAI